MAWDHELEMTLHQLLTNLTGAKVYFTDPRTFWQRRTNENTNRLIRDFFPEKTDFLNDTEEGFQKVEDLINDRRKKKPDGPKVGRIKSIGIRKEVPNCKRVPFQ